MTDYFTVLNLLRNEKADFYLDSNEDNCPVIVVPNANPEGIFSDWMYSFDNNGNLDEVMPCLIAV